ncbi:MAG: hypothetical protein Q8P71_03040 [bacterium]|nr:hypothetical protein [bacterium]
MKKTFAILLFVTGFIVLFGIGSDAHAQGVFVRDITIDSVEGSRVSGSFVLQNTDDEVLRNLRIVFTLFDLQESGQEDGLLHFLLYESIEGNEVSISSQETKQVPFSFVSEFLQPQGQIMRISLRNHMLNEIASGRIDTEFKVDTLPLLLDPSSVMVFGETETGRQEGRNIPLDIDTEHVFLWVPVKNLSDETISVVPKIDVYRRNFPSLAVSRVLDQSYTFSPGEEREIIFYPYEKGSIENPGSYLAYIMLVDKDDPDRRLSSIIDARYVVQGVSAEILKGEFDKNMYKAGEEGVLTVTLVGPADFGFADMDVQAEIFNHRNKSITYVETTTNVGGFATTDVELSFLQEKSNNNPWAVVTVSNNGRVLAEYIVGEETPLPLFPWTLVIGGILLAGVVVYGVVARRKS